MKKIEGNYEYLLRLYSQVDDYLSDTNNKQENLPEMVIAFCITIEKLFKIKLHTENPVLVYDNTKIKENDALVAVIKGKELSIDTIRIAETISRYKLMFENDFSDDEMQVLIDIYNTRNHFIHGYKSDGSILSDKENIVKKMGTVWEKISNQASILFGKENIKTSKPKKKYSEDELEKVLIEEVKKKIQSTHNRYGITDSILGIDLGYQRALSNANLIYSPMSISNEPCPRCGSYNFSLENSNQNFLYPSVITSIASVNPYTAGSSSGLYKCRACDLELTQKEYEIAKKLKK